MGKKRAIPKEWHGCPKMSYHPIAGRFIAFKTPLRESATNSLPAEERLTVHSVFDMLRERGHFMNLWIDLTATDRYYTTADVTSHNCVYVKLPCRVPSYEVTEEFIRQCRDFLNSKPHSFVGVHCTHGFNRTGFLIVSYIVEVLGWDVRSALEEFASARPPGIYRRPLIVELYKRYKVRGPMVVPRLPSWCNSCND